MRRQTADQHYNHALGLCSAGRFSEAVISFDRAIAIEPRAADAWNNRGLALRRLNRLNDALASLDRAVSIDARSAAAHLNRADTLALLSRFDEAINSYDKALELRPDHVPSIANRGIALADLGRHADALDAWDRVTSIDMKSVDAHYNRGNALIALDRPSEAVTAFETATRLAPSDALILNNLGHALRLVGCHADALAAFDRGLALQPDDPDMRCSRALIALAQGDLAAGWSDYDRRFDMKTPVVRPKGIAERFPQWNGEPLTDATILVYWEQGLGDVIQFCRYLSHLANGGARVTFLAPARMHRLLESLSGRIRLVTEMPHGETFDYQCALLTLPRAMKTTLATIPAQVPYLSSDQERVSAWRNRLGDHGLKIGIAWQGNPQSPIEAGRSVPLSQFAPLASIPGVRLISLQRGFGAEQLVGLPGIEDLGSGFDAGPDAFMDTAAVTSICDLVVSIDTAIGHVAGALARPVWVALQYVPDWRWFLDRGDSPWYPSAVLYRQARRGDWADVFERIARDVAQLASGRT